MKTSRIALTVLFVAVTAQSQQRATFMAQNKGGGIPPTFTDNFTRANAVLSSPWAEPVASSTGGDLQIISNKVLAHGTQPGSHYLDIYTGGAFGGNQYCITTVETVATTGPFATQGCVVRGKVLNQYYNDIVPNVTGNGGDWAIGIDDGSDFVIAEPLFTGSTSYSIGDTHELDVVGTNPTFFWSYHNGIPEATAVDTVTNYTGGVPGLGSVVDMNATPTVASGPWTGGTLPPLSTTHTDNFSRPNGLLGVNWWFLPTTDHGVDCAFTIVSHQAASGCTGAADNGVAIWTTAFGSPQGSVVTLGTSAAAGWIGPVVRAAPNQSGTNYYTTIYFGGTMLLFARSGGTFNSLAATLCSPGSTPSTIELDASGTSPVVLTVKVNGSACGSPFSDSTYLLTGAYEGFATAGNSTVAGWTGN